MNRNELEIKLARQLYLLREEKGLSQESLGTQMGKGQSDIAKIENGSKRITVIDLILWFKILDIPIERFAEMIQPLYDSLSIGKSLWSKK